MSKDRDPASRLAEILSELGKLGGLPRPITFFEDRKGRALEPEQLRQIGVRLHSISQDFIHFHMMEKLRFCKLADETEVFFSCKLEEAEKILTTLNGMKAGYALERNKLVFEMAILLFKNPALYTRQYRVVSQTQGWAKEAGNPNPPTLH